jgi:hypothetical protein
MNEKQWATIEVKIPNRMNYSVTWEVDDNAERQEVRIKQALERVENHIRDREQPHD